MKRTLLLLGTLLFASSAQAGRVAVLQSDALPPYTEPVEAFLEALGQPAVVLNLHGRRAEVEGVVKRLRREDPDVVFVLGAKAAYTVHQRLPNAKIVYAMVHDPARYGVAGTRVTGVAATVAPAQYLSQYAGFFPDTRVIGVVRGPLSTEARMVAAQDVARSLELALQVEEVASVRETRRAFFRMAKDVDAIWLQPDRAMLTPELFRLMAEEARRRRIPLLVETDNMVRAGALFAVVPDPASIGRQAASMTRTILGGASPSVLPVEDPGGTWVVFNVDTADQGGIPFDRLILDFVDVVVE